MEKDVSSIFMGTYRHKFDKKHRLALPAEFRRTIESLTEGADGETYGIALSPDKTHLVVLPLKSLFQHAAEGQENTSAHRIAPFCNNFNLDKQGRVIIGKEHRSQLGLNKDNNKLVIAGVYDRIEIWPQEKWDGKEIQRRLDQARPAFGDVVSDHEYGS